MIYGATKAALRSCGRTIAKELTTRGIRVNTISPGPIITPILDKGGLTPAQKHNFIEGAKTRTPLGRTGTAVAVTLNCGCGNGNRFKQMVRLFVRLGDGGRDRIAASKIRRNNNCVPAKFRMGKQRSMKSC
jgi:NAD(P)-dependent dehydrogenase (short-subunit alcohol dehydrogenase family)